MIKTYPKVSGNCITSVELNGKNFSNLNTALESFYDNAAKKEVTTINRVYLKFGNIESGVASDLIEKTALEILLRALKA